MRITGGKYRNRTVACPPGIIRPAMDRMRESLFSILQNMEGLSFLDLFSGSGLVGIEAASRGAEPVILVERDYKKKNTILSNIKMVDSAITLKMMNVQRYIATARESFDLVYADPPFIYSRKQELIATIGKSRLVNQNTIVMIHHPSSDVWEETVGTMECYDVRKYGGSILRFFRKREPTP